MNARLDGIREGVVDPAIGAEFPGIGLLSADCHASRRSSIGVQRELEELAGRINGAIAVHVAAEPTAAAYRALRVGLGMDAAAPVGSIESLMVDRMVSGGFPSRGQPVDGIVIATFEFGVPITTLGPAEGTLSLTIANDAGGAVMIARDGSPLVPAFSSGQAPTDFAEQVEIAAVVAPGVSPGLAAAAIDRARSLARS